MRFWFFSVVYLILHVAGSAQAGARPEISVNAVPMITVTAGLPVQLSDIGGAGFVSADVMSKVRHLVVLEPLADQEVRTYTNAELVRIIKEKVAENSGLMSQKWTYFVPETVKITGDKSAISQGRVMTEILDAVTAKCDPCSVKVNELKIPQVKETAAIVGTDLETSPLKISGSFLLPLRISFDGGTEKIYYVTGQVSTRVKALVASRALQIGEKITMSDVKEQETEVGFSNDAYATSADLDGKTAGRMIQMGRAIYKSDLKREVVVQRGQIIRVVSGNDVFEVSTQMQAEDNGALGDLVRLKNPETQKLMSGKVIDRGVVRVQ